MDVSKHPGVLFRYFPGTYLLGTRHDGVCPAAGRLTRGPMGAPSPLHLLPPAPSLLPSAPTPVRTPDGTAHGSHPRTCVCAKRGVGLGTPASPPRGSTGPAFSDPGRTRPHLLRPRTPPSQTQGGPNPTFSDQGGPYLLRPQGGPHLLRLGAVLRVLSLARNL